MSKHTKEPWHNSTDIRQIESGDGTVICIVSGSVSNKSTVADAKRIVACVNACADMEDPEREIAAIRAEARAEALRGASGKICEACIDEWGAQEPCPYRLNWTIDKCKIRNALCLADELKEREEEGPRVCGNCLYGRSTSLDDIRCYKSCPYIATGLHCKACEDWEPCGTSDNPRALIVERKLKEAKE